MSAITEPLYRLDAHKYREAKLTTIQSRDLPAFTNLTEQDARNIAEFLLDRPIKNLPGTEVVAIAAGSLVVTIQPVAVADSES